MDKKTIEALLNDTTIRTTLVELFYDEAYSEIQSLGGFGLHDENDINRGDALRALLKVRDELLDKS